MINLATEITELGRSKVYNVLNFRVATQNRLLLTNTFLKHHYGRQKPFHWTNINTQKHTHIHQTNVPSRSFSRNIPRVSKHKVSGKFPGGRCFRFFFILNLKIIQVSQTLTIWSKNPLPNNSISQGHLIFKLKTIHLLKWNHCKIQNKKSVL